MRVALLLAVVSLLACGDDASAPAADGPPGQLDGGGSDAGGPDAGAGNFDPVPVNNPAGALCDITPGGETVMIDCDLAADRFTDRDPSDVPAQLKFVAWNVEFGNDAAAVLDSLQNVPELADADFIVMSEVARLSLTSNPDNIDQARELAIALQMDYLFAVEWDRRELPAELGEHGVAILSKYPLGNAVQIRHTPLNDWYAEDMLYGGRITVGADALVGGQLVRIYSSHLCTRGTGDAGRAMQAAEIRVDADLAGRPAAQILGGDLNTYTCNPNVSDCTVPTAAEQTVEDFLAAGWLDGTAGWNGSTQLGAGFFPQRLDWIFYRGATGIPGMGLDTASGSDHRPIYFQFGL